VSYNIRSSLVNLIRTMRQEFVEDVYITINDFNKKYIGTQNANSFYERQRQGYEVVRDD